MAPPLPLAPTTPARGAGAPLVSALLGRLRRAWRAAWGHRAAGAWLRIVQDASPDAFVLLRGVRDADGRLDDFELVYANPNTAAMLEHAPAALVGQRLRALAPAVAESGLLDELARVVETGRVFGREAFRIRETGRKWVRVTAVRIDDGVAVTFSDVTARVEAEARTADVHAELERRVALRTQELEEARERYRFLAEHASDMISSHDEQGRFVYASPALVQQLGASPEELRGRMPIELAHPDDVPVIKAAMQRAIATGEIVTVPWRFPRRDGTTVWLETSGRVVRARGPDALPPAEPGAELPREHFVCATRDVTLRQRYEAELIAARDGAEAANRAKSVFLSRMSHELRTPLNSVIGFANVLLGNRRGTMHPADLRYAERIRANGTHLLALVNDILDLAKIEAERVVVERAPTDLAALVREVGALLEGQPRPPAVRLRLDVPTHVAPVETDATLLRQVLINLGANALKFTHAGSVALALATDPASGAPLHLEVRDTGIGIPPDRLEAIFQPFEQASTGTARAYGGTGLGLAICRSLCEALGYALTVESEEGRGSSFRVTLAGAPPTAA